MQPPYQVDIISVILIVTHIFQRRKLKHRKMKKLMFTQLVSDGAGIWIQVNWFESRVTTSLYCNSINPVNEGFSVI